MLFVRLQFGHITPVLKDLNWLPVEQRNWYDNCFNDSNLMPRDHFKDVYMFTFMYRVFCHIYHIYNQQHYQMKLHVGNNEPVVLEVLHFRRVNTDCMLTCRCSKVSSTGSWFYIKMSYYQYRKSHCGDKTFVRSFSLHNEISYTSKMVSSYWTPHPRWLFVAISIHLYQSVFMFPVNAV